MKIKFLWYDLWVGAFYDRQKRILYICPLPCVVFIFTLKKKDLIVEGKMLHESDLKALVTLTDDLKSYRTKETFKDAIRAIDGFKQVLQKLSDEKTNL